MVKNKKVALVDGYSIEAIIKDNRTDTDFYSVKTVKEGFDKVRNREIDIFIVNAATARYYINRLDYGDLRIATKTEFDLDLKIALHKNLPIEVVSIIDKAIDSITEKERSDIYFKWTEALVREEIDWSLIYQVATGALILFLLIMYWNRKLKEAVDAKTKQLKRLLGLFDKNVIASKTDTKGIIIYASKAFCEISGYKEEEIVGKPQNIIRHPDMPKELFRGLWKTIKNGYIWKGEIKNRKKNGSFYWVEVVITPEFDDKKNIIGYSAIRQDITSKKEVEELSNTLEQKVREQTKDLRKQLKIVKEAEKKQEQLLNEINSQKEFVQTLLNSQEQIIITTDGKILKSCNRTFLDFFEVTTMEEFQKDYNCICDRFDTKAPKDYLQIEIDGQKWIDYVISHSDKIHKAMITIENSSFIFSVTATNLPDTELKCAVFTDITEMERAKQEIELMHRKTRESIEYASLIQGSLIPDHQIFRKYFKDYFAIWHPKDIVGGDIYLFEELRDENECLLMVIDCTGH